MAKTWIRDNKRAKKSKETTKTKATISTKISNTPYQQDWTKCVQDQVKLWNQNSSKTSNPKNKKMIEDGTLKFFMTSICKFKKSNNQEGKVKRNISKAPSNSSKESKLLLR